MEKMNDPPEHRQAGPVRAHRRELSWGVYVPIATLVLGVIAFGHNSFVDVVDRISSLDRIVAANTAAHLRRDSQINHLETRANRIESRIDECAERIAELRALSRQWSVGIADERQ